MRRAAGFTLLEMLVALAVLAIIGALGTRALGAIAEGDAQVSAQLRRWSDVSLALGQIERDVSLAIAAPVSSPEAPLAVLRLGDGDAGRGQSGVRRVGYRVQGATLEYVVWPAGGNQPPAAYAVLDGVARADWQALGETGTWAPIAATPANRLPRAVRLEVALASGERITRIFPFR